MITTKIIILIWSILDCYIMKVDCFKCANSVLTDSHWTRKVAIMSALVAMQVVVMTTCSAISDDKVDIRSMLDFQSSWPLWSTDDLFYLFDHLMTYSTSLMIWWPILPLLILSMLTQVLLIFPGICGSNRAWHCQNCTCHRTGHAMLDTAPCACGWLIDALIPLNTWRFGQNGQCL